ncbi:SMI1/KNR4 family protein [Streptomyces sp. N35]|uniref:SMI1/KNR4 family protein n=1 Tax=Streptomyces sp. N35 TaxID=2795730 RepID=UPI0018F2E19D|nr:SMI1/KNR4 family protein [Streptomyces sp. N35]
MHHFLDDLLGHAANATPPAPPLHGDPDLDLADLVEALSEDYGRPRTVVLDGEVDPTTDDRTGAPLLAVLGEQEVEVLRAWSYGKRWIGAGRAPNGSVFVVLAERVTPTDHYDPTSPEASYVERVVALTHWSTDRTHPVDWAETEAGLGTPLPADYKRLVEIFGQGAFDDDLTLHTPLPPFGWVGLAADFLTLHETSGDWPDAGHHDDLAAARAALAEAPGKLLFSWASNENGAFYWHLNDPDPDRWPVLVGGDTYDDLDLAADSTAECLHLLLTDPRAPFSLARHFDRHWFSPHAER